MKPLVKKTLLSVLISFIKWLLSIGKQHVEKYEQKNDKGE